MHFVVYFVLIIGAGGTFFKQPANQLRVNNKKVNVIVAYNLLSRWRRNEDVDFLPAEATTVHVIGGDMDQLHMIFPHLTENQNKLKSKIDSEDGFPMLVNASLAYYSFVEDLFASFTTSAKRRWTCGTWITIEELVPDLENLFAYVHDTSNNDSVTYKFLERQLQTFKNEAELNNNINSLKTMGKVAEALDEIRNMLMRFFTLTWFDKSNVNCEDKIPGIRALIALEGRLLEAMPGDECHYRVLNSRRTFESALKHLDEVFADEELLHILIPVPTVVKTIRDQHARIKKITKNPLALFSLESFRDMLIGKIRLLPRTDVDCRMKDRVMDVKISMLEIWYVLPAKGSLCSESWKNVKVDQDIMNPEHMKQYKSSLMKKINQIPGIDDVFEIFSTEMEHYFRKPYIGIPFSDMPVKHGLWWIASQLFDYDDCHQFTEVQILRQFLEQYSETFYNVHLNALDQCGLLPTIDTDDSFIMADNRQDMMYYDMARSFDYTELVVNVNWFFGDKTVTENGYERYLRKTFSKIMDRDLSVDHEDYKKRELKYRNEWMVFGELKYYEIDGISYSQWDNLSCEFYHIVAGRIDYQLVKMMNFIEDRIYPSSYEQDIYEKAHRKLVERDQSALSECGDVETTFEKYKNLNKDLLSLDMMQIPDIFSMYKTYMQVEGLEWENFIDQANITYFKSMVDKRLEKSGNRKIGKYYILYFIVLSGRFVHS